MDNNKYKEMFDEISVPDALKKKTTLLMQEQAPVRKKKIFSWKIVFPFVGACAMVFAFVFMQMQNKDTIHFELNQNLVEKPPQFSAIEEEGSLSDADLFFGKQKVNALQIEGYEKNTKVKKLLKGDNSIRNILVEISFINKDKEINLTYMKSNKEDLETNSTIKGVDMALKEDDTLYVASFVEEGIYYHVTAENLSEAEFVDFLKDVL